MSRFEERNTSSILPSELLLSADIPVGFTPSNIANKEQRPGGSFTCGGPQAENPVPGLGHADKENLLSVLRMRVKSQAEDVQERLMKLEEQGVIKIND